MHGDTGRPDWMPLGLEATGQVDGQTPVGQHYALFDRPVPFADWRQAHGLINQQFSDSEAVVNLGEIQLLQANPGLVQRAADSLSRAFEGQDVAGGHG
ncbi:hypothetical protein D3C71_1897190 [compost metagenome]